jgi:hypothetical protein
MDHRRRAFGKTAQRGRIFEHTGNPGDARAIRLRPAGECAHRDAAGEREIDKMRPDEAGTAGDRDRDQSITIWSRWTSAARGA